MVVSIRTVGVPNFKIERGYLFFALIMFCRGGCGLIRQREKGHNDAAPEGPGMAVTYLADRSITCIPSRLLKETQKDADVTFLRHSCS